MAALPQFEELSLSPAFASSVEFVVVNYENAPDEMKQRAEDKGFNCTYIIDKSGIVKSWGIEGAPFAAVVNADGKIELYDFFNVKSLVKELSAVAMADWKANLKPLFPIFAEGEQDNAFDFKKFAEPYKLVIVAFEKAGEIITQGDVSEIKEFAESFGKDKGIGVLVIDVSEDKEDAAQFYADESFPFKVIYDPSGVTMDSADLMDTPHYILVTPDGKIVDSGSMNPDRLNHYIEIMLGNRAYEPYVEDSPAAG